MKNKQKKLWFRLLAIFAILLVALAFVQTARAFEDDPDGYIPEDETVNDDLVISYDEVIIDGKVIGDVMASGNSVTLNGSIEGNLLINAGTAKINGTVSGSVAFIGQRLTINSSVEGTVYFMGAEMVMGENGVVNHNVMFFGYSLISFPGSLVSRDIRATGMQMQLGGTIGENLEADLDALEINGAVEGDAIVEIDAPSNKALQPLWLNIWWQAARYNVTPPEAIPTGIRIASDAQINGELRYESLIEQAEAIKITPGGGTQFLPAPPKVTHGELRDRAGVMKFAQEFLTLLAFGALAVWQTPSALVRSSKKISEKPLGSTGMGLVAVIGGFSAGLVSFVLIIIIGVLFSVVTLGGLAATVFGLGFSSLSLMLGIFVLILVYGSKLAVTYWGGDWIMRRVFRSQADLKFLSLLTGLTIYMLLRLIPGVRVVIALLATIIGMGALTLAFIRWKKEQKHAMMSNEVEVVSEE